MLKLWDLIFPPGNWKGVWSVVREAQGPHARVPDAGFSVSRWLENLKQSGPKAIVLEGVPSPRSRAGAKRFRSNAVAHGW